MGGYEVVYCDPPWSYTHNTYSARDNDGVKSVSLSHVTDKYPTLSLVEMMCWDLGSILSDNALIFMWATGPVLEESFPLMNSWGFSFMTVGFVWEKVKVNPGYYTMSSCEYVLIGKRGTIPQPRGSRSVRQFHQELSTRHSAKPDEIRERIEEMFPTQKKLEMFCRTPKEGWDIFGNEVDSSIVIPKRSRLEVKRLGSVMWRKWA
jgi:N6-adenosine-specific RNA methylase IME4